MIVEAAQKVDVIRDLWDWVGLAAGVVGALGAGVAIWFSLRAQRDATKARRAVGKERCRQFELEILRDIVEAVDRGAIAGVPVALSQVQVMKQRVALLHGDPLPTWRKLMLADKKAALSLAGMDDQIAAAEAALRAHSDTAPKGDEHAWQLERSRLAHDASRLQNAAVQRVKDQLLNELHEAIRDRVDAADD